MIATRAREAGEASAKELAGANKADWKVSTEQTKVGEKGTKGAVERKTDTLSAKFGRRPWSYLAQDLVTFG